MKIGIIYDGKGGTDWSIPAFKREFEKRGIKTNLLDVETINGYERIVSPEDVDILQVQKLIDKGYVLWMNRIYPSKANKENISKGLNIVSWLNSRGYETVSPLTACAADYDKFFAYQLMQKYKIPTPKTLRLTKEKSLDDYVKKISLPCVVKRNTGGKGKGVIKVNKYEELAELLRKEEIMSGEYLIQEFVNPIKDHDIRVGVINGEVVLSYGRSLIKKGDNEKAWMGSCSHGSKVIDYEASEEEKRIAIASSRAIGATLNEVDIQVTANGPMVIENNLTPGYAGEDREFWVGLIVSHILNPTDKEES